MSELMSKALADRQFEAGDESKPEAVTPSCEGCEAEDKPLSDYYSGQMRTPLMLCDDCRDRKAEAAYERSCADFYGGSGDANSARLLREAGRRAS